MNPDHSSVVVAGAGLAGVSCAYHLKSPAVVIDRERQVGGTARSVSVGGFTFDFTGHLLHLHNSYTRGLVRRLLRGNMVECVRRAWIHSHGVQTPYPFQANLYGLPPSVVRDCVDGVRSARALYGDHPFPEGCPTPTFKEWCLRLFGKGISRHFMIPYNEKLWGVPATEMTPEWCGNFVPVPTLAEVESGAQRPHRKQFGYNTTFLYPRHGGIQVLAEAFATKIPDLRLGVSLEAVDWRRRRVRLSSGEILSYRRLVSTLPLPELLKRLDPFPKELEGPLAQLKWTTVLCVNVGVARPNISKASWIYFPEKKFPFYRVGFPMNFTPHVVPRGCSSMYVEVSCRPGSEPGTDAQRETVFRQIRRGLLAAGILKPNDTFPVVHFAPIRYAYVIYDDNRSASLAAIFHWLRDKAGAVSIGRYGAWKYSFMEEAILDGRAAAMLVQR
ncbi:MAG: FAD-dependent oxidoreductase [Elusimicrobia bacterium]|nr:FAD-dependent oxidoreductase [Elusimicrobiota bacterium]